MATMPGAQLQRRPIHRLRYNSPHIVCHEDERIIGESLSYEGEAGEKLAGSWREGQHMQHAICDFLTCTTSTVTLQ